MVRLPNLSRSLRRPIWFVAGVGIIVTAGCGETSKPTVKAGDSATSYEVPPPPKIEDGKPVASSGKGSMSARELRDFRKKQQGQTP
jgi:hypothetical protein